MFTKLSGAAARRRVSVQHNGDVVDCGGVEAPATTDTQAGGGSGGSWWRISGDGVVDPPRVHEDHDDGEDDGDEGRDEEESSLAADLEIAVVEFSVAPLEWLR